METLKNKLTNELQKLEIANGEPDILIYFDSASAYWASCNGFLYIENHTDIKDYIDENHKLELGAFAEGVGAEGVFWNNKDLNQPFHISEIQEKIENVNV